MSKIGTNWTDADVESWAQADDMSAAAAFGKIVTLHATEGQVEFADATTEEVYGVIVATSVGSAAGLVVGILPVSSGKIAMVVVDGTTDIAIGNRIGASTTDGVGIKTTTDGHHVVGRALEAFTSNTTGRIPVALGYAQAAS